MLGRGSRDGFARGAKLRECTLSRWACTTSSLLGKADVKKMRANLLGEFPTLTKKLLDSVLSDKKDITLNMDEQYLEC